MIGRARVRDVDMFTHKVMPVGTLRECVVGGCGFHTFVRSGTHPGYRGYGFVAGNKARGTMIQHFKTAHPEIYAALHDAAKG